jgi:hypothetical protein
LISPQKWRGGGAQERYRAITISTPSPSRAKYASTLGRSARRCVPGVGAVRDLGQDLASAVTLRIPVALHQREPQRPPGEAQREVSTGSVGNL